MSRASLDRPAARGDDPEEVPGAGPDRGGAGDLGDPFQRLAGVVGAAAEPRPGPGGQQPAGPVRGVGGQGGGPLGTAGGHGVRGPVRRSLRDAFHRGGRGFVRAEHGFAEMPGAPVVVAVVDGARRGGVQPAPVGRRGRGVQRRADQRVPEPHLVGSDGEQSHRLRPLESRRRRPRGRRRPGRPRPAPGRRPPRSGPPSERRGRARPRGARTPGPATPCSGRGNSVGEAVRAPGSAISSRMARGLPTDRAMTWSTRRPPGSPSSARTRAPVASGSMPVRVSCGSPAPASRHGSPSRNATMTAMASASSRRATNSRASCEGGSSWWASSMIRQSGVTSLRWVSRVSSPAPTAKRSAVSPGGQREGDSQRLRLGRRQVGRDRPS